jgi:biotin carboxylase
VRPGDTGEPTPYRRQQDTLTGVGGPVPPEHLAAARAAARESRPAFEPSLAPQQRQIDLYRARAEAAERELRAAKGSIAPPALSDEAVGKLVKASVNALAKKIGLPAVLIAMLGLGGAGYKVATDKPTPPALTAAQLDERLERLHTRKGGLHDLVRSTNAQLYVTKCLRRKMNEIGGALLPAPDRMGPARRPQPFDDDCPDSARPLPEP